MDRVGQALRNAQSVGGPPRGLPQGGPPGRGEGGPPAGRTPGGPPGQGPGSVARGPLLFTPPGGRGAPAAVTFRLPAQLKTNLQLFNPGRVISGTVAGREGNKVLLNLGEHMVKADSRVQLEVGQRVQFKVQGQNQGQIQLQLVKTPFTKMATADLTQTLTNLKLPVNEGNVALAKTMVEHSIPLTKENIQFFKTVLAQPAAPQAATGQPASMPSRVAATSFLQASNLPVTPQNVSNIANFLNSNPQVGAQLFAVNTELRRMTKASAGDGRAAIEMMTGVQGALGDFILEPKRKQTAAKKPSKKLMDLARQTGIETNLGTFGAGEDAWDLLDMMRKLRGQLQESGEECQRLLALLQGLEENLEAQRLINQAKTESDLGFYYLQVPMRLDNEDVAEIWVRYFTDEEGNRCVDPEDTRIEFLVTTEHLGELYYTVDLKGGVVHIDLGTPNEEVREFAARYLPALADRVAGLGWKPGRMGATYRPFSGRRRLVERQDFEELERCDVQA